MTTNEDRILEALQGIEEPLTRIEIAALSGVKVSSAQHDLRQLTNAGKLFKRPETRFDRGVRRGNVAGPRLANLYATVNPVPPRTMPALCEGSMTALTGMAKAGKITIRPQQKVDSVQAFVNQKTNTLERAEKVARIRDSVTGTLRDVSQVAAAAGVSTSFAREVLYLLVEIGEAESTKKAGKRGFFYRTVLKLPEITSDEVLPVAAVVEAEAVVETATQDVDRASALVAELAAEFGLVVVPPHVYHDLMVEFDMLQSEYNRVVNELTALRTKVAAVLA